MADEPIEYVPSFADEVKTSCYSRMVAHLNSVSFPVLEYYPQSEVQSWDIQRTEAAAVLAAGETATLDMAPFLTQVCSVHFQTQDPAALLAHLKEKAAIVHANAGNWATLAAWINGTRVRYQIELDAAQTSDEVFAIFHDAIAEIDQFKLDNNL